METINFDEASPAGGGASQQEEKNQNRKKKLIWAGAVLVVLILAVLGWQYWQYTHSMYYQQMKYVKELEKIAKESDKWGGKTPEETVRLFTEAVKKSDFDLASKYGRPEEIKTDLERIKNDGNIDLLIKDLEAGVVEEGELGSRYADLMVEESGKKYTVLSMYKSDGGTWKIVTF